MNVLRDDNIQIGIVDDNPSRLRRNIPEQNFQFNDGNLIFPTTQLRSGEVGKLSRYQGEGIVVKDELNGKTVKFLKFTKNRLHQVG